MGPKIVWRYQVERMEEPGFGLPSEPPNQVKRGRRTADALSMRRRYRVIASGLVSGLVAFLIPMLVATPARAGVSEGPGTIVFTGTEGGGKTHIYVVNGDGSGLMRLTALKYSDQDARWSPSGRSIVFSSNRSGFWDIWMKNLTTGKVVQLTKAHLDDSQPVWSPDGTTIAFIRTSGGVGDLWTVDLATRQVQQVSHENAVDADPAWSADSQWIAYDSSQFAITKPYYINVFTHTRSQITYATGNYWDPAPSPDNDSLLLVSDRAGGRAIWTMDVTLGSFTQLTDGTTTDLSPSWSAYGSMIVFSRSSGGDPALFTMAPDGTGQTPLSTGTVTDDTNPQWLPLTAGQRTYDDQVKNNLLRATNDVNVIYSEDGSYQNWNFYRLAGIDFSLQWQSLASTGPVVMSVAGSGSPYDTFAVAAMSNSGECFAFRVVSGVTVTYGQTPAAANCTGNWAMSNATQSQWSV